MCVSSCDAECSLTLLRMKILLSGPPGTGKSHLGDWLQTHRDFTHLNMEDWPDHINKASWDALNLEEFSRELESLNDNVVLSWGFPSCCFDRVRLLQSVGVVPVWLDAPLLFCRRNWRPKHNQSLHDFVDQMRALSELAETLGGFYSQHIILVTNSNFEHVSETLLADQLIQIGRG